MLFLKSNTRQNPIIILIVSVLTTDRETNLSYGFYGCITKLIDPFEFDQEIQQVLYGKA